MSLPFRLLIDAGHGGADPGCVHNSVTEKDFTLSMALMLRDVCRPLGMCVDMTRVQDVTLPLHSRLGNGQYDLVVCLHADASADPLQGGLDVYAKAGDTSAIRAGSIIAQHAPSLLRRKEPRVTPCVPSDWTHRAYNCLAGHTCPAILVECGFLTNKAQAEYLSSCAGRWGIAASILHAISDARSGQGVFSV